MFIHDGAIYWQINVGSRNGLARNQWHTFTFSWTTSLLIKWQLKFKPYNWKLNCHVTDFAITCECTDCWNDNLRSRWSRQSWYRDNYRKTSSIRLTKSKKYIFPVSSCRCLCLIHWSQVLSREWRCSWSSADRRCSNFIWVINKFMAH